MTVPNQKVTLVTGGGRQRVGNIIAKSLAKIGYDIALHYYTSAEAATDTAEEIRQVGVECETYRAHVSVETDVESMFDAIQTQFGRVDVLVTTASIWESMPLEEVTADDLLRNFRINTLGTFLCAQRAGLMMAADPAGGAIVTIGDWAIKRPYLDRAAYFLSKGAIPRLTKTLAVKLTHRNPRVRVNCIHPGPVMFPPDSTLEERDAIADSTLLKQANNPLTIAEAVKFLAANEFVTGV